MYSLRQKKTDVLVVGAGLTGLRAAISAAKTGKNVVVASKGPRCSYGVMGFNAAVERLDGEELYYSDILESGKGLTDPALAGIMAHDSTVQKDFLESCGLCFDKDADGEYDLLQPLGCSRPRLVHVGRFTGTESEKVFLNMLSAMGVEVSFDTTVIDILSDGKRVYGALAVEKDELICFLSKTVVMAAGGCGDLYPVTTYPKGIQGDGYALIARAGGELVDMEMMQYEPCCLAEPEHLKGKGISTTMLNAGAKLLNGNGEEFIPKYFPDPKTMQKGSLARAMFREIENCGGKSIQYDLSAISPEELEMHCLWTKELKSCGIDPAVTPLAVCPAAHTFLGGARVNKDCECSVEGLYAAGENLGGLHGANRIGGCAGAETYVFGAVAGNAAAKKCDTLAADDETGISLAEGLMNEYMSTHGTALSNDESIRKELQNAVNSGLSIIRCADGICSAGKKAEELSDEVMKLTWRNTEELVKIISLRNMTLLAKLIAKASLSREESRGVFFRSDYPEERGEFKKNITVRLENGTITAEPV